MIGIIVQMSPVWGKNKSSKSNPKAFCHHWWCAAVDIQSASETWQAVKHEEQKRLRDTGYENSAQSAAISQQIIITPGLTTSIAAKRAQSRERFHNWRSKLLAVLSAREENVRASIEVQAALTQALLDLEYTLVRADWWHCRKPQRPYRQLGGKRHITLDFTSTSQWVIGLMQIIKKTK